MYQNPLDSNYLTADDVLLNPQSGILSSRKDARIDPFIYSAPMDTITGKDMVDAMIELGEFPVVCRYLPEWADVFAEHYDNPDVFFAVGADLSPLDDGIKFLIQNNQFQNAQLSICVDIAHGDSPLGRAAVAKLAAIPQVKNVMCGSIATAYQARAMVSAGATHLRIGIGPGSVCTTRLMTGIGVPQLSAVYNIHEGLGLLRDGIVLIADGGIRNPGDAVKYMAAGADAIMMGSVFKACPETPGWELDRASGDALACCLPDVDPYIPEEVATRYVKRYRGQASASFQKSQGFKFKCAEGVETGEIEQGAFVAEVVERFKGGLASALSYLGMSSTTELSPANVEFIQITPAGLSENRPHAVVA
jgi:IMP dehydrogenase/GMP reductase